MLSIPRLPFDRPRQALFLAKTHRIGGHYSLEAILNTDALSIFLVVDLAFRLIQLHFHARIDHVFCSNKYA